MVWVEKKDGVGSDGRGENVFTDVDGYRVEAEGWEKGGVWVVGER